MINKQGLIMKKKQRNNILKGPSRSPLAKSDNIISLIANHSSREVKQVVRRGLFSQKLTYYKIQRSLIKRFVSSEI